MMPPVALGWGLQGLHHVGIAATESEPTCAFYRDALGFAVEWETDFAPQQVHVVVLRNGDARLEVLTPLTPDCATGRFLAKRGPGLHHLCYAVNDLETARAALQRPPAELVRPQPEPGLWGPVLFLHPRSAFGVMIELLQADA